MMIHQSPLETLASYAIAYAAGVLSVCLFVAYGRWIESGGMRGS